MPTDQPEDEEPPEEPPLVIKPTPPPLVIEPTQPEAVILPIQPEAPLLYEEEDQTTKPPEQVFIPHYKNYSFATKLSDYSQPELEEKFDEITNEQLAINRLLNDQLSMIGIAMPSNGITPQFLTKNKDVLTDDLIDLISYSEDLQGEERRIQKRILELEQAKPSLQAEEPAQFTELKSPDLATNKPPDVQLIEDKI